MMKQTERLGVKFIEDDASAVNFSSRPFTVKLSGSETISGDAVIIATGASAIWLGLESEQRLRGKGVSACATCDGFFFKGKEVVVVGGGDAALEEALFLSRLASKVTLVHRRADLRASRIMQQRALTNTKISFVWNSVVEEILGEEKVQGARLKNLKTGQGSDLACTGVFIAIGHRPNSELFRGQIELDEKGYIKLENGDTRASVEGVFVAGDVYDYKYRQAVTAAASGCRAAIDAIRYLEALENP
jgi:thioredoxin reductase (NADPH)